VAVDGDRHRALGSRLAGGRLGLREGSLSRRHTVIAPDEVVAYRVRRSPGQRRAGLCTLTVDLGQGAGSRRALDADAGGATGLLRDLAPDLMAPLVTGDPRPRE
jgi:putative membrane protein